MRRVFRLLLCFSLLAGVFGLAVPVSAGSGATGLLAPADYVNADGTVNLGTGASGGLDLTGWDVRMDPLLGPQFVPLAKEDGWAAVGTKSPAFNTYATHVLVNGSDVYVGGGFYDVGGNTAADTLVRWNGTQWLALGSTGSGDGALDMIVEDMLFVGSDLYVVGYGYAKDSNGSMLANSFGFVKWNGTTWSAVPGLTTSLGDRVSSIAYHAADNAIYIAGEFINANAIPEADRVAKLDLDTNTWSALGSNGASNGAIPAWVTSVAVDSAGNVYAGGFFTNVNNNGTTIPEADYIAKWDGANWSALGGSGGIGAINGVVGDIDIDASNNVYVGGSFDNAGGVATADVIAKWNGSAWSGLGSNGSGNGAIYNTGSGGTAAQEIVLSGTKVYVGGAFNGITDHTLDYAAVYDSNTDTWSGFGGNGVTSSSINDAVYGVAVSGSNVYVAGNFTNINNMGSILPAADYFGVWNGANWNTLENPVGVLNAKVNAVALLGSDLYVGGDFTDLGGSSSIDYIARWNGTSWAELGNGTNAIKGPVNALAVNGTDLYVGGDFTNVLDVTTSLPIAAADRIARWDGSNWHALGSGTAGDGSLANGAVNAIQVSAGQVYVGGSFVNVVNNGTTLGAADYLAKFDGADWSALSSNGAGNGSLSGVVNALEVGGSGTIYAGGAFLNVNNGGTPIPEADFIARWDGSNWSAVGTSAALSNNVYALEVVGDYLYVGGAFLNANGLGEADYFARVDTTSNTWSALDANAAGVNAFNGAVRSIFANAGLLYAGGEFTNVVNSGASIAAADYVARWDGVNWSALGNNGAGNGSLNNFVYALGIRLNDLYVGGSFIDVVNSNTIAVKDADYIAVFGIEPVPPTVTVSQSVGQLDPHTISDAIHFDVVFSEPVTGFDENDVLVDGTAGGYVSFVGGSGDTYTLDVYPSDIGTVIVTIPAGAAQGTYSGLGNLESTSTDNTVTFSPPVALPGIPTLISPAAGATVNPNNTLFDWSDSVPAAYGYTLQVSLNNAFSPFSSIGSGDSNCDCNFGLQPGKVYYWRVQAWNYAGNTKGWSVIRSFKTSLAQPVLVAPDPGAILLTNTAYFDWNGVTGATSYQLQASLASNFSTLLLNVNTADTAYTATKDLPKDKTIHWRVAAKTTQVTSAWSTSSTFVTGNPPTVPTLAAPLNNTLLTTLQPKLDWNNSTVPVSTTFDHYQLQVATNTQFSSLTMDANFSGVTNSMYQFGPALSPATYYYWRVRSYNTDGEYSSWSLVRSFRTLFSPPANLNAQNTTETLKPTFDWDDSAQSGVTGYQIQYSTSPTFATLTGKANVASSQYTPTVALPQNKTIYWRVNVLGTYGPSAWTIGTSFLSANPPGVPTLLLPADNASTVNYLPQFDWSNSALPLGTTFRHYQIQVDDNNDFSSPLKDAQTTSGDIADSDFLLDMALTPNTKYYWRVRAHNQDGAYSNWSVVRALRAAPLPPTLVSPASGALSVPLKPLFEWNAVSGATSYTIQASTSANFNTLLLNSTSNNTSYQAVSNLPAGTTIYWRVRVVTPNGTSLWVTQQFTTQ